MSHDKLHRDMHPNLDVPRAARSTMSQIAIGLAATLVALGLAIVV